MSWLSSCADREIRYRYPYVSHLICNAGCGAFNGINWPVAIKQCLTHPLVGVTVTEYKRQIPGRMSDDGLGYIWQCNVFSHYALVSSHITLPSFVNRNDILLSIVTSNPSLIHMREYPLNPLAYYGPPH